MQSVGNVGKKERPRALTVKWKLWVAGGVVAAAALVLGVGQLVLPPFAQEAVREELSHYGTVRRVSVSAFPALTLLWDEAESIGASATNLAFTPAQLYSLLGKISGVYRARLSAPTVTLNLSQPLAGTVTMGEAVLEKRGATVFGKGLITPSDLNLALPGGLQVGALRSSEGSPELLVRAAFGPLALQVGGVLTVQEGRVVISPTGFGALDSLATLTVFKSPRVFFETITATETAAGLVVTVSGKALS